MAGYTHAGGFARNFRDFFEGRILLKYDLLRTPEY